MAPGRHSAVAVLLAGLVVLAIVTPGSEAWGEDGHAIICEIAQSLLKTSAVNGVANLLPASANGNMSSVCSWADEVRYTKRYAWSAPLHFVDTPDQACNYNYKRDCFGDSKANFCSAGAINNYTTQLMGESSKKYNLTEALLFLIHIVGDIHQPLHCGFKGDLGGNDIEVDWYTFRTNLHHVWDTPIIETTYEDYFDDEASELTTAILDNITGVWSDEAATWGTCPTGLPPCPDTSSVPGIVSTGHVENLWSDEDIPDSVKEFRALPRYATESVTLACSEAYANVDGNEVQEGDTLGDPYFQSRYPVVLKRLAMGGVRLASILNTIFEQRSVMKQ